jgi:hypothetical protein
VIAVWNGLFRCVTTSRLGYGRTAERRSARDPAIVHAFDVLLLQLFYQQRRSEHQVYTIATCRAWHRVWVAAADAGLQPAGQAPCLGGAIGASTRDR